MNPHRPGPDTRWKAVWGPRRTAGVLLLVLLGLIPNLAAGADRRPNTNRRSAQSPSRHYRQAPTTRPGLPSRRVRNYKVDDGLTRRIRNHQRWETADVIACVQPGQELPARYLRYAKRGKFSVIACYALDRLPIDELEALGKVSELHRVHENRRSFGQDLLSSTAVQADVLARQYGYTGAGVTVAFIDSGLTQYSHPDVADSANPPVR